MKFRRIPRVLTPAGNRRLRGMYRCLRSANTLHPQFRAARGSHDTNSNTYLQEWCESVAGCGVSGKSVQQEVLTEYRYSGVWVILGRDPRRPSIGPGFGSGCYIKKPPQNNPPPLPATALSTTVLHESVNPTSRMNNLDTTTPQMRAVKGFMDAFISRDVESIKPLIAKDYTFQTFPKSAGTSDETEAQIQRHGRIMASLTKFEVRMTLGNFLRVHS